MGMVGMVGTRGSRLLAGPLPKLAVDLDRRAGVARAAVLSAPVSRSVVRAALDLGDRVTVRNRTSHRAAGETLGYCSNAGDGVRIMIFSPRVRAPYPVLF